MATSKYFAPCTPDVIRRVTALPMVRDTYMETKERLSTSSEITVMTKSWKALAAVSRLSMKVNHLS